MAFDPQVANLLEIGRKAGNPPFQALTPEQARLAYAAAKEALQPAEQPVADVRDVSVPLSWGSLNLRIYRGIGTPANAALPCLLFLHGGGWVIGNLESHDRLCRHLANVGKLCVVAVDYRLAPEHRFPAALDDSADALRWVSAHAAELNIDPARLAVGGDSAGGNLAAVLALMSRDGNLPALKAQVLLYPVTDLTASSDSYARMTSGVPLTADTMHYFIGHYTPDEKERKDWRASPLWASSLEGSAPAFVLTVANDPLCDEGRAYAARLEKEGVRVSAIHLSDHVHGMLMHGKWVDAAPRMADFVGAWLAGMLSIPAR